MLDTAAAGQTLAVSTQQVITDLQRARTEQVNRESAARLAKQKADQAVVDAQTSQDAAVAALTQAQQTFADQQGQLDQLTAERTAAQAQARRRPAQWSAPGAPRPPAEPAAAPPANPSTDWDRDPAARRARQRASGTPPWDPTLPAIPSAFVSGDPIAIINTVLGIASTSAQATPARWAAASCRSSESCPPPSGYTNGAIPRVYGRQASEYVIKRAGSQMGVPYSWGGGNAAGPSRGIDSGAGTVGFDCSGLILYAFAGVGIKLPHYSGAQYDMGRKIPSSQMRRGDVIFYGPGGSQHVTLYLGNGQMLEAPVHRLEREDLARAHQRHDAVRHPLHRILMVIVLRLNVSRRCAKARRRSLVRAGADDRCSPRPPSADPDDGAVGSDAAQACSAPALPVTRWPSPTRRSRRAQMALQTTQSLGQQVPAEHRSRRQRRPPARRRWPGARTAGHRVRDPPRRLADGRAVLVGRRRAQRPERRRRLRRGQDRLRLLRASPGTRSPVSAC